MVDGTVLDSLTINSGYESLTAPMTRPVSNGSSTLYSVNYMRDNDGRITQKTETANGVTNTWVYGYDGDGRLNAVTENGNPVASYGYDQNGNRVSMNAANIASHDNQDRLVTYGDNSYTYNANGELLTKASATTDYS